QGAAAAPAEAVCRAPRSDGTRPMSNEPAGAPNDRHDRADREWSRRSRAMGWAWIAVVVGLLLMVGSIVPSLANGLRVRTGIVLGDAEVVAVFGVGVVVM